MPLYKGLLISTERKGEKSASSEIHFVLSNKLEIDESLFKVRLTRVSGLITVALDESLDSHQLIRRMIALEQQEAYFMHCLKIRPVDYVMDADIDQFVDHLRGQSISRTGSFRISVNKRHTPISSMDVISPVADLFPENDVDLDEPDWEIWVEILADILGYAIIEPELVFSTDLAYIQEDDNVPNWFLD